MEHRAPRSTCRRGRQVRAVPADAASTAPRQAGSPMMRRLPHAVAKHREKRGRSTHRQWAIGGGITAFAHRSSNTVITPTGDASGPAFSCTLRAVANPSEDILDAVAKHVGGRGCLMRRQRAVWRRPMTTFAHRSLRATAPPTPRRPRLDRSVEVDARRLPHLNLPSLPCPLAGPCDPGNPALARKRLAGGRIPRIAWTGKHSLYGRQGLRKGYLIWLAWRSKTVSNNSSAPGCSCHGGASPPAKSRRFAIGVVADCATEAVFRPTRSPVEEALQRGDGRFSACRRHLVRIGIGGMVAAISEAVLDLAEPVRPLSRPSDGIMPRGGPGRHRGHGRVKNGSRHARAMPKLGR